MKYFSFENRPVDAESHWAKEMNHAHHVCTRRPVPSRHACSSEALPQFARQVRQMREGGEAGPLPRCQGAFR